MTYEKLITKLKYDKLVKENNEMLERLKRTTEPEIRNYTYYKGKQDAYNDMLKIRK